MNTNDQSYVNKSLELSLLRDNIIFASDKMVTAGVKLVVAYFLAVFLLHFMADAEIIRTPNVCDQKNTWRDCVITLFFVRQFPPKVMIGAYRSFSRRCREESKVTQESIDKFNEGEDFDKLPNDRPLKCYMRCQMINMEMMEPNASIIKSNNILENTHGFSDRDRDIFIKMGVKCIQMKDKKKEACDLAYEWNKCMKRGDINVRSILVSISIYIQTCLFFAELDRTLGLKNLLMEWKYRSAGAV